MFIIHTFGKNDHPASISNIVVEEVQICEEFEVGRIDCLARMNLYP